MKRYQIYVCEVCGKESRDRDEIERCEASHLGLSVEEKHAWDALKYIAQSCGSIVYDTNNRKTRAAYDKAIEKLVEFEKEHGLTWQEDKMLYSVENPTLEQLEYRLEMAKRFLKQHPEHRELLERRIERTNREIEARFKKNLTNTDFTTATQELFQLSFMEAMNAVFNGSYVQGENFKWNCFLMEKDERVVIGIFNEENAMKYSDCGNLTITKGVVEQKYRVVSTLNRSGLYHK